MSLLVCACFENYAVVAADSRAVKVEQGRVVQIGDRFGKFWTLADGMIAVGSTGSLLVNRMLSRFTHEIAEQCRGSEVLFATLEQVIPEFAQIVSPAITKLRDETHLAETIPLALSDCDLRKSSMLLCGYDSSQQRIREIYWTEDLTPGQFVRENIVVGSITVAGPKKVTELVTELISQELGDVFMPGDVAKAMKNAIQIAAENSEVIGGPIRTHVIMTPRFKEELRQFNELLVAT